MCMYHCCLILYLQAISESVTQQEDDSVLKCLIELAENVPKFLRPQGENVVAFCMKVRMRSMGTAKQNI